MIFLFPVLQVPYSMGQLIQSPTENWPKVLIQGLTLTLTLTPTVGYSAEDPDSMRYRAGWQPKDCCVAVAFSIWVDVTLS